MEDIKFKCKECGCQQYTIVDGFYYCEDCGFQNETVVMVHDDFARRRGDKTRLKGPSETQTSESKYDGKRELTSWEGHNYILKGLTDQLIQLGAPEGLKTTVFQLWAFYLRLNQAAFFSKDEEALPKLGVEVKYRDKKILYNFPARQRKKYKRAQSSTTMSHRAKKRKLTNLINLSQVSEYNSVMASQRSLNASSLGDMSASEIRSLASSSASSANTIELQFSEVAKRRLLKKMSKEHLQEHARDFNHELKCHRAMFCDLRVKETILTRATLIAILLIALDVHETAFRISDLLRFSREGHLTLHQVQHFLPADITNTNVKYIQSTFKIQWYSHSSMRTHLRATSDFLLMDVRCPNMYELCSRYVDELALPRDVMTIVGRLINFHEPKFKRPYRSAESATLPAFHEGRAMAYIIFVLKLLFGINDETENIISESAKEVNNKKPSRKLFVWTEWLAYIEMRKIIVSKFHAPTQMMLKSLEGLHGNSYHNLLQNQKRTLVDENGEEIVRDPIIVTRVPNPKRDRVVINRYKFLQEFFPTLEKIFAVEPDELQSFGPTLTPFKTYLETILQLYPEYATHFADLDQTSRAVFPFIEPEQLQAEFLQTHKCHINIQPAPIATHMKFHKHRRPENKDVRLRNFHRPIYKKIRTNISVDDWLRDLAEKDRTESETAKRREARYHNATKEEFDRYREKMNKKHRKTYEFQEDAMTFVTPNYDLWLNLFNILFASGTMYKRLKSDFPVAFDWLIEECALMIEADPGDIYSQLVIIENFYTHVIGPINDTKDDLKYRDLDELPRLVKTITRRAQRSW